MLSSCPFTNTTIPIFYEDDNVLTYFPTDQTNPNHSKQEEPPPYPISDYYYHFPSPFTYNNEIENFNDFLTNYDISITQEAAVAHNNMEVPTSKLDSEKAEEVNGIVEDCAVKKMASTSSNPKGVKRRRTSNKDRHSKIRTAQGLRDRRMRLSVGVAGQFFRLQELLGHDKPSQTVEWLLSRSRAAIEEVQQSKNGSMSGVTKCTLSSISDCDDGESIIVEQRSVGRKKIKKAVACVANDKVAPPKRRVTTREAREGARARARKRTVEKRRSGGAKEELLQSRGHGDDLGVGNWNPSPTLSDQRRNVSNT